MPRNPKKLTDTELAYYLENDEDDIDIPFARESDTYCVESEDSEKEIIQESDLDSNSEQSDVECDDENMEDEDFFVGRDKQTKWYKNPQISKFSKTATLNIVKISSGPTHLARNVPDVSTAFHKFMDIQIIDEILMYTNLYIRNHQTPKYARERDAKEVTRAELLAVLGLLYLSGVKKANHTNFRELWTDDGTGIEIFRGCMSYKRFLFLLGSIRFDDKQTRSDRRKVDKLAPIRSTLDLFVANCKKSYCVGEFVTIDEKLEPFRGRCSFIQYIPNKPAKYGIKIFAMCDSKTFYTQNLEVYCGKQPDGPYAKQNTPTDIVHRLLEPVKGKSRNLTCDNWYTSIPLAKALLKDKITLVGTLKKNKREIPPEFLPNKNKTIKTSIFGFQKDVTMVSHATKKNKGVILISTMHSDSSIDQDSNKPEIITFYNSTKGGIDTVDQLCNSYSVSRRTRRWPLAIFFSLLNVAGINAQIIYNASHPDSPQIRRVFLKNLSLNLMKLHLTERTTISSLPTNIKSILAKHVVAEDIHEVIPEEKSRGRCCFCPKAKRINTTINCSTCRKFACKKHLAIKYTCQNCSIIIDEDYNC